MFVFSNFSKVLNNTPSLSGYFSLLMSGMLIPLTCSAGLPMTVDDASITQAKECQFQSWMQHNQDGNQYWLAPACNFTGNYEWSFGVAHISPKEQADTTAFDLQVKTLLPFLSSKHVATAVSLATQATDHDFHKTTTTLNVPVTFSMPIDSWLVHVNTGMIHQPSQPKRFTWGLGTEYTFPQVNVAAEVYGNQKDHTDWQFGLRRWLIQDVLQITGSYGQNLNNHDGFFSVGFVWVKGI